MGDGLIPIQPGGDRKGSVYYPLFFVNVVDKYSFRVDFSEISWVVFLMADFCKLFISPCHLIWLYLWGYVLFIHNLSTFLQDGINAIFGELARVV
jgi:hypothetical protein